MDFLKPKKTTDKDEDLFKKARAESDDKFGELLDFGKKKGTAIDPDLGF